ncbi:hypothetical protein BDZ94DRAFT_1257884 [Collybia nuda]|uniref:Transmembrane protein n=1 Tax=Collybia nuda TaxID=64659 RepID=A0A9P5Y866_9AGAR|nr:hypothetical protein BDZ94DRAFT_1257884 [Collybia nuda]
MSTIHANASSAASDRPKYPPNLVVNVVPSSPAVKDWESEQGDIHSRPSHEQSIDPHHLHAPDVQRPAHDHRELIPISSGSQTQILTAIIIGAPLIASVVGSCLSVVVADLTSSLGPDPLTRPARASAVIALLWSAMLTSLGSAMTAVAGLAMHAGYHDAHVGITKKIVRLLREWRAARKTLPDHGELRTRGTRPTSPVPTVLSAITDGHRGQHAAVSFRAAVVASRLLGISVMLLAIGLAVYLFLIYPLSVAVVVLVVGVVTTIVAASPLLPVLFASKT